MERSFNSCWFVRERVPKFSTIGPVVNICIAWLPFFIRLLVPRLIQKFSIQNGKGKSLESTRKERIGSFFLLKRKMTAHSKAKRRRIPTECGWWSLSSRLKSGAGWLNYSGSAITQRQEKKKKEKIRREDTEMYLMHIIVKQYVILSFQYHCNIIITILS